MSLKEHIKGLAKKDVISWALFDFANSSYSVLILSFVFPIYFKDIVAGSQYGDFYWGLIGSISILIAGIVSPVIGTIADHDSRRKSKFIWCVVLSTIATLFLFFCKSGTLVFASLVFIASNLFYSLSTSLYDSFLASVSTKKNAGAVSGLGYGLGYLGGIVAMLLLKPLYTHGYSGEFEFLYRLTFPITALFFIVFSVPSFVYLKDKKSVKNVKRKDGIIALTKLGIKKTIKSIKNFKNNKDLAWFLVAFYCMSDALATIFAFISLYAIKTIGMSIDKVAIIFIIVQVVAIPASFLFGWLADRIGQKKVLLVSIFGWICVALLLVFGSSEFLMYCIAVLTGLVIGGSQSVARSWFSNVVPENKRFEMFGFNSFASKVSATIGPILFGVISSFTGNERLAMLSVVPFFVASFIIFFTLKEKP